MIVLQEAQIAHLAEKLQQAGLQHAILQEELLDHLCCAVEEKMDTGLTFEQAAEEALNAFPQPELQAIQTQILSIHSSNYLAMKISLFALVSMLAVISWQQFFFAEPPNIAPINGKLSITSGFGMRIHPVFKEEKMHKGIDIKAPIGTPVQATSDGTVVTAEFNKFYGKYIVIKHDEQYQTLYAHLSKINVQAGQTIQKGDIIGAVGNTGPSPDPHLHYEVIKDGKYEDPEGYIIP